MKKLNFLSVLMILFTAIGFVSCDSEPVDPLLIDNGEQTGPAQFKVDFSGATYIADQTAAVVSGNTISISGIKTSNGSSFTLTVPGTTTGTYDGGDEQFPLMAYHPTLTSAFMYVNVDPSLETENPTGSITITSINTSAHTISGTFNFTGYWTDEEANQPNIAFTNGSFQNIPYTGNIGPQPTDSLFKVKIDGTQFTADDVLATMGEGLTNIAGFRGANGEYVAIVINGTTSGTYTDDAIMSYAVSEDDENVYSNLFSETARTVTISINTANHTVSGTFSFTGVNEAGDEKVFTEGVFENIPYTTENETGDIFKATVDGTLIDYANSVITTWADGGSGANIGIQGIGADNTGIRLSISDDLGEGIYPITGDIMGDITAYYSEDEDTELRASGGSVTITAKEDGHIVGTFQYVITNDAGDVIHEVTGGQFDVEY